MRVLLVEDDANVASIVRRALTEAGYAVDVCGDAITAGEAVTVDSYDLLVLDLMLPGRSGIDFCREVREVDSDVPVLMLTALGSLPQRVTGLDAGADDYLTKPFHLEELLARVRALTRRAPRADAPMLTVGTVRLDAATKVAWRGTREVPLTAKEFCVLQHLMRNTGRIVSVSELIDHAWDRNYDGYSNVVPTYIRYLRGKLNAGGETDVILTHRGLGYSFSGAE